MMRVALFLALIVSACAAGGDSAPIAYGGASGPPASSPARAAHAGETPAVQAEPNWAEGEGIALSAYALRSEDVQPFDPARMPRTHRVGANESLHDIATRYQIPLLALIAQNGLEPPYALGPGRLIELPPPRIHRVARGESFEDVARGNNIDPRSLALLNRMRAPYRVEPGDEIVLPAVAAAHPSPRGEDVAPPSVALRATAPPLAGEQIGTRFTWPVRGDIVARFGAQAGGRRIDGIEIAGEEGAPIGAAEAGDVVYAGDDLPGYGTLVLVRHADGYVTAYGYARRALVREGQHVRAGEPIAELGRVANGRPRLLFQVRRGRDAVDPAPLLGGS